MSFLDRFRRAEPTPPAEAPPKSTSGRGHTAGFLDLEEHNTDLRHPNGQTIYDQMWRTDADIRQVGSLMINPIIAGTWAIEAHGGENATDEDANVAAFVRHCLFEQMEPDLLGHLSEFLPVLIRGGFVPGELAWMPVEWKGETKVCPRRIYLRLPRTIAQWEQDAYEDLTRIKQYPESPKSSVIRREDGVEPQGINQPDPGEVWLEAKDLVYYRLGAEGDNWEGMSLLRPAYKHWKYKDVIEKLAAIGMERESLGVPICYPPLGASEDQLDEMEEILRSMRTNEEGFIIAPGPKAGSGFAPEGQGWLIEILGYDRTGSGRDPQPLLEYHSAKISAAFIAEFMRLGHGQTGARATAQVQADPFLAAIEAVTTIVERVINHLIAKIVAYNFVGVANPPKAKMSLVDSTSLQQLADFVQKLIMAGAMIPDQELEDFLRARADLPPSDPEAVRKRAKQDDKLRREVVVPPKPDPFGANDKPGTQHGIKPAPGSQKGGSMGGGNRPATKDKKLMILDDGTAVLAEPMSDRYRWRDQRWYEMMVDLDGLEDTMDDQPRLFERNTHDQIVNMAREMVAGRPATSDDLAASIKVGLDHAYALGQAHVVHEIHAQRTPVQDESVMAFAEAHDLPCLTMLDRGARDRGGDLERRAQIAADQVQTAMRHAHQGADLTHGQAGPAQAAAEAAGKAAMRRVGHQHGVAALLHGRHDMGHQLAEADNGIDIIGARYSAILDRHTCEHCLDADDGVLRPLDDPVRLDRQPPNHHCSSTASGFNQCRCFEVFEVMPPTDNPTLSDGASIPDFARVVAAQLIDAGMDATRALAAARSIARSYCRTGHLLWPGLANLGLTRADACDVVSWQP